MPEGDASSHCGGTGKIRGGRREQPDVLSKTTEATQADTGETTLLEDFGISLEEILALTELATDETFGAKGEFARLHAVIAGKN